MALRQDLIVLISLFYQTVLYANYQHLSLYILIERLTLLKYPYTVSPDEVHDSHL